MLINAETALQFWRKQYGRCFYSIVGLTVTFLLLVLSLSNQERLLSEDCVDLNCRIKGVSHRTFSTNQSAITKDDDSSMRFSLFRQMRAKKPWSREKAEAILLSWNIDQTALLKKNTDFGVVSDKAEDFYLLKETVKDNIQEIDLLNVTFSSDLVQLKDMQMTEAFITSNNDLAISKPRLSSEIMETTVVQSASNVSSDNHVFLRRPGSHYRKTFDANKYHSTTNGDQRNTFPTLSQLTTNHVPLPFRSKFWSVPNDRNFPMLIEHPEKCSSRSVVMIVGIFTKPQDFEVRQQLRNQGAWWSTIGSPQKWEVIAIFLLGVPKNAAIQRRIKEEDSLFGDIVQQSFLDVYENLTLKSLLGLDWAMKHCPRARWYLKMDFDTKISAEVVAQFITQYGVFNGTVKRDADDFIYCPVVKFAGPIRDRRHRWWVSEEVYPESYYPLHCEGGRGYVLPMKHVPEFLRWAATTRFFWIEDVYVSGILMVLARINLFQYSFVS